MHVRIDTDARTPAERATAAEVLRATADMLEQAAEAQAGSEPEADQESAAVE